MTYTSGNLGRSVLSTGCMGVLASIMSDRGPIFPSNFQKELLVRWVTELRMSNSYQTENEQLLPDGGLNQILGDILEVFCFCATGLKWLMR